MMIEDFIFDPILAAKILLRIKVPPHEELRILWMWSKYYTNDDSGFSTGKSFTFAVIAALRSILLKGRISGIISKTFAQGKLIFANFDRWYDNCPIFKNMIKVGSGGKHRLVHATDVWSAHFRGGSEIRVLPPDFFKDAERIKSERWNDGYFDEWTSYGNFDALNKTLIGRCTKENYFADCPVRQNHIHLGSTPNFTHHPSYEIIKRTDYQLAQGNQDYGRFSCNYRHIPETKDWQWLVSKKTIFQMQISLPKNIVECEVDGKWKEDSGTYYPSAIVSGTRCGTSTYIHRRTTSEEIFLAAADIARSNKISKKERSGDDFALSVFRLKKPNSHPHHCFTIRKSGVNASQMSGIIHKYHRMYNFTLFGIDILGGGLFVLDELKKESQLIDNEQCIVNPMLEIDDRSGVIGQKIIVPIRRGPRPIDIMWGKMNSESVMVNRIHQEMKKAIENKEILLASDWEGWESDKSDWDVNAKREWLNQNTGLQYEEKIKAEMDLAVCQLILVDIKRDKLGIPMVDSFGMYKFASKQKKDAAYSLIYTNFIYTLWNFCREKKILNFGEQKESFSFASCPI